MKITNYWKLSAIIVAVMCIPHMVFAQGQITTSTPPFVTVHVDQPVAYTNIDVTVGGIPITLAHVPVKWVVYITLAFVFIPWVANALLHAIKDQPADSKLQPLISFLKVLNRSTPAKHVETVTPPLPPQEPTAKDKLEKFLADNPDAAKLIVPAQASQPNQTLNAAASPTTH